ncbi:PP2C family protein-serine/threonine phosphatase [Corynebacterium tapiri]|uniref:Serine/threonine-protein phosphatase n=1 Tax=Corynebacterium tapiri TaxID=1448266 RepID=A0A5C4U4N3_9CORY|nr:PP2C family serine/threonine-protein phosphatase [Corynebacterium tapiri]TNL96836.1 serine/threonine-protein phosphatase [Corynebacterium tapiri]
MTHTYRLNFTAASDRGLVRGNNEDSAYAGPNLLVLADGMGGHAAGEVASQMMVKHLEELDRDPADADMLDLLAHSADAANRGIAQHVRENPETEGMGTTLTALLFNGDEAGMIHVGDSRGYRLRDGKLTQLTVDDTFVQSLVDEGKLDPEEVSSHPKKSLILKAYTGIRVEPGLARIALQPGDRFLLCSDGLSDPVTASTIEATLAEGTPQEAAQRLVDLALRSGGPDNVTVVVADVLDESTLTDTDRRHLPTAALVAGALAGDIDNPTHPDTSAGRAAALRSVPARREAPSLAQPEDPDSDDGEDDRSNVGRWVGLIVALVLVLSAVGAGWWALSRLDDTYFLAVDEHDEFVIEQGADLTIFGRDLHHPQQKACINEAGDLRLFDVATPPKDCTVFGLNSVPESARSSVTALDSGSFDEVNQQLQRLADQALPVCLTVDQKPANVNKPGVTCREV